MRRTVLKLALFALMPLFIASCDGMTGLPGLGGTNTENPDNPDDPNNPNTPNTPDNPNNPDDKPATADLTLLAPELSGVEDDYYAWLDKDRVMINDEVYTMTLDKKDQNKAAVTVDTASIYTAYYPTDLVGMVDGKLQTLVSQKQTYIKGNYVYGSLPMAAVGAAPELQFHNLAAVAAVSVKGANANLTSAVIYGNNGEALAGSLLYASPDDLASGEALDTCDSLSVKIKGGLELSDEYQDIWFVIPAGTYEKGLTVVLTDDSGNRYVERTDSSVEMSVDRVNTILNCSIVVSTPDNPDNPDNPDDPYIDPNAKWTTVSETAWMDCGLLTPWDVGNFACGYLEVQQMDGADFFRIVNIHSVINYIVDAPLFLDLETGEDQYIYVDARDNNAVVIMYPYSVLYVNPEFLGEEYDPVFYLISMGLYYEEGYSFGKYDKNAGVISLGNLAYLFGEYILEVSSSALHLNIDGTDAPGGSAPEPPAGGLQIEDFKLNEKIEW